MKRYILFTLSIFFLFIGIIKAENCTVTSGTGKEFGDEVKCGTEPFYVIDYNENTTKLLAKYNLYVGDKIDYLEADETAPKNIPELQVQDYLTDDKTLEYCMNLGESKGRNPYYAAAFVKQNGTNSSNFTYTLTGCRIYEKIEYEHVKQNEKAIGTTFKSDGTSYYPQIGITYMNEQWGYDYIHDNIKHKNEYDGPLSMLEYCMNYTSNHSFCNMVVPDDTRDAYGDLILEGSSFEKYINGYKEELERQNINFKDVDFLHLSGFKDIYKKMTNEDLYLKFTYDGYLSYGEENVDYNSSGKLPLADKIPEKYKWLYATTFWLGSGSLWETEIQDNYGVSEYNDYYFTTEGILCSLGRGICHYTDIPIGGGVRPVLTINNEYIKQAISEDSSVKENPNTKDIAISLALIGLILSLSVILYNKKRLKVIE